MLPLSVLANCVGRTNLLSKSSLITGIVAQNEIRLKVGRQIVRMYGGSKEQLEAIIGKREIVGWGFNGMPSYVDRADYPFPAIRYKETTPDIQALRGKERGDWRLLSIKDKKSLYRSSFCLTFEEMQAPTGEWMSVIGWTLIWSSLGIFYFYLQSKIIYKSPLPKSFSYESVKEQRKRMINLQTNPHFGIASMWDYDKMQWKNKGSFFSPRNPFDEDC